MRNTDVTDTFITSSGNEVLQKFLRGLESEVAAGVGRALTG